MGPERRRNPRTTIDGDGPSGVVRGVSAVALRDLSAGGICLRLPSALQPGAVYPLLAFLRGLSVATPIRVTRCRPGAGAAGDGGAGLWEAGAEFLFREDGDAAAVRHWLERRAVSPS